MCGAETAEEHYVDALELDEDDRLDPIESDTTISEKVLIETNYNGQTLWVLKLEVEKQIDELILTT